MFVDCAKYVSKKKADDKVKGTTDILNELLADTTWLSKVSVNGSVSAFQGRICNDFYFTFVAFLRNPKHLAANMDNRTEDERKLKLDN